MFAVASDLSEIQRERLASFLSTQRMDVTAYTFLKGKDNIRGIVLYAEKLNKESFSSNKQTQRPSLEILQFVQITVIVVDGSAQEFGQWQKMNYLASKVTLTMKIYASARGTTISLHGNPDRSRAVR